MDGWPTEVSSAATRAVKRYVVERYGLGTTRPSQMTTADGLPDHQSIRTSRPGFGARTTASGPTTSTPTSTSPCSGSTGANYPMAGFATLLGLGAVQAPTTGDQILSPLTPERIVRRRGRATGLTSVRFPNPPMPVSQADRWGTLAGGASMVSDNRGGQE